MATVRRFIASCLLFALGLGLFTLAHGFEREGGGDRAFAIASQLDHSSTCAAEPICAPFTLAAEVEEGAFRPAISSAALAAYSRSWFRSPHLADEGPPPRSPV